MGWPLLTIFSNLLGSQSVTGSPLTKLGPDEGKIGVGRSSPTRTVVERAEVVFSRYRGQESTALHRGADVNQFYNDRITNYCVAW
jgi:hypothetical protein